MCCPASVLKMANQICAPGACYTVQGRKVALCLADSLSLRFESSFELRITFGAWSTHKSEMLLALGCMVYIMNAAVVVFRQAWIALVARCLLTKVNENYGHHLIRQNF